jgi:hypothetical protein
LVEGTSFFGRKTVSLSPISWGTKMIDQDMPREPHSDFSDGSHNRGSAFDFQHI